MNPHSVRSQYNQRPPRTGSLPPSSRPMNIHKPSDPILLNKPSKETNDVPLKSKDVNIPTRPIASNSRIRRDSGYRKDMYLAFVHNALQQKLKGASEPFDELVSQFDSRKLGTDDGATISQLRSWISALSHVVSQLEPAHSTLVDAILGIPWTLLDAAFVKSYISFIGMLVSARPEYLVPVLTRTAQGLTHQSGFKSLLTNIPESSTNPLTRGTVYDRHHSLLQHLLSLIPTLPSSLQPLLIRNFPHKRLPKSSQVTFIRNLLRIADYCPSLSDKIIGTIVERAIQIDVEIQIDLDELEEFQAENNAEVIDMDPFENPVDAPDDDDEDSEGEDGEDETGFSDISSDAGESTGDVQDVTEQPPDVAHISSMAQKLDAILKLLLQHFEEIRLPRPPTPPEGSRTPSGMPGFLPPEERHEIRVRQFYTLLSIFDSTIIKTLKSRYTQFLLFWFTSLDPQFVDLFEGLLVSKALVEEAQPAIIRVAAASYIGSFVSRSTCVDQQSARQVVHYLCLFLGDYARSIPPGTQINPAQHGVFYAVAQSLFLIFCFRWRDFHVGDAKDDLEFELGFEQSFGDSKPKAWISDLDVVQQIVHSQLNPLKFCSVNVVKQFARVANKTGFLYVHPILEMNKRMEYSTLQSRQAVSTKRTAVVNAQALSTTDLNTFFPFDPFHLPLSRSYIEPIYREWQSVELQGSDDEDEYDDEADDDEEADQDEDEDDARTETEGIHIRRASPGSKDDVDEGLGRSFEGMSISPVRPPWPTSSF
ncbi:RNA polymerase I-specific transcription initiation factor RRN3 [Sistotremastrum niveocremeum HHB9708]|uniref:RNA polymerase I-specific transcription initiation factor RRN3 n=1 Tax=Sistotremastrum niveocremeum HHB9708 TaxID=1314777 RepID=A0A164NY86_9AGAM|nr:RNA polymerase I-specific transcription initiation factor RRN3 [Sistotremastrum niveocremeum HHB9708]